MPTQQNSTPTKTYIVTLVIECPLTTGDDGAWKEDHNGEEGNNPRTYEEHLEILINDEACGAIASIVRADLPFHYTKTTDAPEDEPVHVFVSNVRLTTDDEETIEESNNAGL